MESEEILQLIEARPGHDQLKKDLRKILEGDSSPEVSVNGDGMMKLLVVAFFSSLGLEIRYTKLNSILIQPETVFHGRTDFS